MKVSRTREFSNWIARLSDRAGRARILMPVDQLTHGNPGDHRNLTGGVSELRIDVGPGYRVYYSQQGDRLLLLLVGGDKSTQTRDIETAIRLAKAFQKDDP